MEDITYNNSDLETLVQEFGPEPPLVNLSIKPSSNPGSHMKREFLRLEAKIPPEYGASKTYLVSRHELMKLARDLLDQIDPSWRKSD